jgi:hypothetical protein
LSRPFFDLDARFSRSEDSNTIECPEHGPYSISLKAHGCPDCAVEDLIEEQEEEALDRSKIARFTKATNKR